MFVSKIRLSVKIRFLVTMITSNILLILMVYIAYQEGSLGIFWIIPLLFVMFATYSFISWILFALSAMIIVNEKYLLEKVHDGYKFFMPIHEITFIKKFDNSTIPHLITRMMHRNSIMVGNEQYFLVINTWFADQEALVHSSEEMVCKAGGSVKVDL